MGLNNPYMTLKRLVVVSTQQLNPLVDIYYTLFTGIDVELLTFKWAQTNTAPAIQRIDVQLTIDGETFTAIGVLPGSGEIIKHVLSDVATALTVNPFLDEYAAPDSTPLGIIFQDGAAVQGIAGIPSGRLTTIELRTDVAPAANLQYDMDIMYHQMELG